MGKKTSPKGYTSLQRSIVKASVQDSGGKTNAEVAARLRHEAQNWRAAAVAARATGNPFSSATGTFHERVARALDEEAERFANLP